LLGAKTKKQGVSDKGEKKNKKTKEHKREPKVKNG